MEILKTFRKNVFLFQKHENGVLGNRRNVKVLTFHRNIENSVSSVCNISETSSKKIIRVLKEQEVLNKIIVARDMLENF